MTLFPNSQSWLKGIALFFYNLPAIFVVWLFYRYFNFFTSPFIESILQGEASIYWVLFFFSISLLLYWLSFSYLYHLIWGKPDPNPKHLKWLPANASMQEGFLKTIFSLISWGACTLLLLPFLDILQYQEWSKSLLFILWVIVASFLWQIKTLISNKKVVTK